MARTSQRRAEQAKDTGQVELGRDDWRGDVTILAQQKHPPPTSLGSFGKSSGLNPGGVFLFDFPPAWVLLL